MAARANVPLRIVQLVPAERGGVRDHAEGLALEWSRRGISSELIAFDAAAARSASLATRLLQSAPEGEPSRVLLHYSGYGYARRGLAFWLLRELEQARRALGPRCRFVAMVHELFVSGAPWQPAFWLGRLQAHVVQRAVRLCDAVVTNSSHHGAWLAAQVRHDTDVRVSPVFSNVGEPAGVLTASARDSGLVVFGSASTRQRAFDRLEPHLAELRALGVQHVVEAGPGPASAFAGNSLQRSHAGELAPSQIEALLQRHRYGLIDYPSFHLGKSGVFAAYAAHGCIVLDTAPHPVHADGLGSGRHYVTLGQGAGARLTRSFEDAMARRLRTWYFAHRRSQQASRFLADLLG